METRTATTILSAPKTQVFDYLSRVENLPAWATEFARELRYEDGKPKVVNGLGEFYFVIDADPATGDGPSLTRSAPAGSRARAGASGTGTRRARRTSREPGTW